MFFLGWKDVMSIIFKYLEPQDILNLTACCKSLYNMNQRKEIMDFFSLPSKEKIVISSKKGYERLLFGNLLKNHIIYNDQTSTYMLNLSMINSIKYHHENIVLRLIPYLINRTLDYNSKWIEHIVQANLNQSIVKILMLVNDIDKLEYLKMCIVIFACRHGNMYVLKLLRDDIKMFDREKYLFLLSSGQCRNIEIMKYIYELYEWNDSELKYILTDYYDNHNPFSMCDLNNIECIKFLHKHEDINICCQKHIF